MTQESLKISELVSIITVNYNGWKDTCELIASLKRYEKYPYEIIVVDNASSGEDTKRILDEHPDVTLICSEKNLGFAGGNNLGCLQAKGKYLFFLNNDIVLKGPVLEPLVQRLKDPSIGGVSPMIRGFYPPNDVQYYGHQKMTPVTLKHATPPYDVLHPEKYVIDREVEVMHGAAMMLRREVIEDVGMMSEVYFLFYEEFDWSYRILKRHYKIWYEPASVVFHKEGQTIRLETPFREYYLTRGRVLFARRNLGGFYKIASCCYLAGIVMTRNMVKYLFHSKWKMLKATVAGTFSGLFCKKDDEVIHSGGKNKFK
ncbi:MAG: glycosyltransferase family 2 protein [Bacteroides sp.]|jgi:GT2 family glycosyltransferase|nr:glycosyltransferase family 2 protein [Bacteroides sp.]MCI1683068.1 glycosyltransferase family 2 protein [Bacteroides sp.]